MENISNKKLRFARELLSSQSPESAAHYACFPKMDGYDLIKDKEVMDYYDKLRKSQMTGIRQKVISRLLEIIDVNLFEYFDKDGKLRPITRSTPGRCIDNVTIYNNGSYSFSVPDKLKAIELLMKLLDIEKISLDEHSINDFIKPEKVIKGTKKGHKEADKELDDISDILNSID